MGIGKAGEGPIPATPDIGYSDARWPDPLGSTGDRAIYLLQTAWALWEKKMAEREERKKMGYYKAGGPASPPAGNLVMANQPAYSGATYQQLPAGSLHLSGPDWGPSRPSHRMNVGNVRALRRSMRRVQGFAHLARKVMTFTKSHKMRKRRRK